MRHFIQIKISLIELRISLVGYREINYYYEDEPNKIGDFSSYYGTSYGDWDKYRRYRGKFIYSKQAHKETSNGIKMWNYDGKWHSSYEYMMAIM